MIRAQRRVTRRPDHAADEADVRVAGRWFSDGMPGWVAPVFGGAGGALIGLLVASPMLILGLPIAGIATGFVLNATN